MRGNWKKPKLVVLTRGRPEEAILQVCKNQAGQPSGGPDNVNHPCEGPNCGPGCVDISNS